MNSFSRGHHVFSINAVIKKFCLLNNPSPPHYVGTLEVMFIHNLTNGFSLHPFLYKKPGKQLPTNQIKESAYGHDI